MEETAYNIGTWYGGSILTLGAVNSTICPGVATLVSKNEDQISIAAQEVSSDRSQPMQADQAECLHGNLTQQLAIANSDATARTSDWPRECRNIYSDINGPIGERLSLLDKHKPHAR